MNKFKFLLLIITMVYYNGYSQSTLELYSQEGLSFAYDNVDDTGQIFERSKYFIKNVLIDSVEYLQYQTNFCDTFHIRVEGEKVFWSNVSTGEESLRFDFGLEIGDSITRNLIISPIGLVELTFGVSNIDTVVLLDGNPRKRIQLNSNTIFPAELIWMEGVDLNHFDRQIVCVKDVNGSVFLETTEEICNSRTSKLSTSILEQEKKLELFIFYPNPAENYIELDLNQNSSLTIFTFKGQALNSYYFEKGRNKIDISHLSPNMYLLKIKTNEGVQTKRLVVK